MQAKTVTATGAPTGRRDSLEPSDIDWKMVPFRGLTHGLRPRPVDLPTIVEDLPDGLRAQLAERVGRLGYINGFLAVGLHHPGAILALLQMTEQLKSALDPAHVLVVALATHHALGNEYERVQYLDAARASGMSERWIKAAQGQGFGPLTPAEEAVRRLTLAVVSAEPTALALAEAGEHLEDSGLVAIVHLAARFVSTSRISHALSLQPMTGRSGPDAGDAFQASRLCPPFSPPPRTTQLETGPS